MRTGIVVSSLAALAFFVGACADGPPTAPSETPGVAPVAGAPSGSLIEASFTKGNATRDLTKLSARGWLCENVPGLGVHCFAPGAFAAAQTVTILVFDTSDPANEDAHFLGTEILILDDLYSGQPCPPEGGEYELLPASETPFPVDYRACHHYSHED